jgi:hypothetical protein
VPLIKALPKHSLLAGWRKDLAPWLLFLFLPLLCFPELFFQQRTLYRADLTWIHYPLRLLAAEQWKSGQVPLWNPYILSGSPLLADAQIGVLQPLNAIFLLPIPPYRALSLFVALNLSLAATFTYILARSLGIGRVGATIGGLSFGFGGFLMAQITNLNVMTGAVWLPLVLAAFAWALRTRRPAAALLAGLPLALHILAAQPQIAFYTVLLLVGYALYQTLRIARRPSPGTHRLREGVIVWGLLFLGFSSGLMLAAPQFLPTWELQRLSVRAAGVGSGHAIFSIPPVQWLTLVLTSVYGNNASPSYQGLGGTNFEETYVYIGILPLVLVPLSWRARHRPEVPFLWLAALGAALLSMGDFLPLYRLTQNLPGFNLFRAPARWSVIASLALALLAAYGLDEFLRRPVGRRLRIGLIGLWAAAAGIIVLTWFVKEPVYRWTDSLPSRGQFTYTLRLLSRRGLFEVADGYENRILLGPLAWWVLPSVALVSRLGAGVALLGLYSARRLPGRAFATGVIALVALDVSLAGGSAVNPLTDASHWQQLSGGAKYIINREQDSSARFYAFADSNVKDVVAGLKHYFPSVYHVYGSSGETPLRLERYDTFTQQAHPLNMLSLTSSRYVLNKGRLTPDAEAVLPLVYHDDQWYVYEYPATLPHAFAMHQAVVTDSADAALAYLRDGNFNPLSLLVLEGDQSLSGLADDVALASQSQDTQEKVVITRYTPAAVEIQASLNRPGFLVLLDSYYPGWQAYVDGHRESIMRAYYFARAVYLDAGMHTVRFVYRPASFYGGVGLAATGLLIIAASGWLTWRRKATSRIVSLDDKERKTHVT